MLLDPRLVVDSVLRVRLRAVLPHGITAHLDAMSFVDQPVEDAIRQRGIADLLVPARYWQLGRHDHGAHLITILTDLPEVTAFGFRQRGHGPVVDDQDIDAAESREQASQAAVCPSHCQIAE